MEAFLTQLGLLLATFLVLAAAVEVILDVFRNLLESLGIQQTRRSVSLDDALALAGQVTNDKPDLQARLSALRAVALDLSRRSAAAEDAGQLLAQLAGPKTEAELAALAADIKAVFDRSERLRLAILRTLAALLGCALVYLARIPVLDLLVPTVQGASWMNVIVGGFAAAAGSSYWHDKLDQVRKLKTAADSITAPL